MILIPLSQGRCALVDDEDADLLAWKWYARPDRSTFYAYRDVSRPSGGKTSLRLHRVIADRMGINGLVDHRNRCGLDNRRENLRSATTSQNISNTGLWRSNRSGYKGVSWHKRTRKWTANITINTKQIWLGDYRAAEDAARAYDAAAVKYRGEFAVLNFPRAPHERAA